MDNIKIGDVINDIKSYPDFLFNTIFSDPPYQLGTEYCIDPKTGGYAIKGASKDFMNKWEGITPEQWDIFFHEGFRVLKYGGYCCLFGMEESGAILQYYAIKNGFEICQSLSWYNIQGFPKSINISKSIDKKLGLEREIIGNRKLLGKARKMKGNNFLVERDIEETDSIDITIPNSDLAKKYNGYHGGKKPLKPCLEIIYVFRKPLKGKSLVDDIMNYEKGDNEISPSCINIDECRVEKKENDDYGRSNAKSNGETNKGNFFNGLKSNNDLNNYASPLGRYPSQLYVDSEAAELLNEQSGILKSGMLSPEHNIKVKPKGIYGELGTARVTHLYEANEGGASRILHICPYENEEDNKIVYFASKVSPKERNAGVEKNSHPTLKPMSLIYKLFSLFKLPIEDQKVYVPFAGTFSEVMGILATGIKEENIYPCEKNEEYVNIGKSRLEYWKKNKFSFRTKENKTKNEETTKSDSQTIFDLEE